MKAYRFGGAINREHDIKEYFNDEIASTIKRLYRDVGDMDNCFGNPSIVRAPLSQRTIIQPDIVHMINKSELGMQYREIVFGIGGYQKENYELTQGFEELKAAIESHAERLLNLRRLRLHSIEKLFEDKEW